MSISRPIRNIRYCKFISAIITTSQGWILEVVYGGKSWTMTFDKIDEVSGDPCAEQLSTQKTNFQSTTLKMCALHHWIYDKKCWLSSTLFRLNDSLDFILVYIVLKCSWRFFTTTEHQFLFLQHVGVAAHKYSSVIIPLFASLICMQCNNLSWAIWYIETQSSALKTISQPNAASRNCINRKEALMGLLLASSNSQ